MNPTLLRRARACSVVLTCGGAHVCSAVCHTLALRAVAAPPHHPLTLNNKRNTSFSSIIMSNYYTHSRTW